MKKENIILLLVATFVVGFLAGAVGGIKFYAAEMAKDRPAVRPEAARGELDPGEEARLEASVRNDPHNVRTLIALANFCFDTNQYRKAIDAYQRALAIDPRNADVRTDLGTMYRGVKDYDRAIEQFREAARLDPAHKNSRFNLGVVLEHDKRDVNGAIAAWKDYLRVDPSGERAEMARTEIEQLKTLAK